jgi:hypothetical protein
LRCRPVPAFRRCYTWTRQHGDDAAESGGRGDQWKVLADPPICRAAAKGHREAVKHLVKGTRLSLNEGKIAGHDTALCIAIRGGDLEMIQVLLCHEQIDIISLVGGSRIL